VGGHWGLIPKVARLALEGLIEGWNLPQGVISHLYRDIAAGKPGTLTHVGLGTFVDPRREGGRINDISTEDLVEVVQIGGQERLFYKAFPIHVALLRGTTADPAGNITMEREALVIDNLAQAMAVRNSGGTVIVQVERIAARGTLNPRQVQIPAALVDAVVVAPPEDHAQTFATALQSPVRGPVPRPRGGHPADGARCPQDHRAARGLRAARERRGQSRDRDARGRGRGRRRGGAAGPCHPDRRARRDRGPAGLGARFRRAVNTDAIIPQAAQFDFYDGGGLDLAVLGLAEADAEGNVNVSRFGSRLAGAGGFINISQNARRVVFAGTFTAGGLRIGLSDGRLAILEEGRAQKLHAAVGQVTFSGARAAALGTPVLFVTERCVFELGPEGLRLTEVAPGIDIERDILGQMGFAPLIDAPEEMDARIFGEGPMGLRSDLLHLDLADRMALGPENKRLFLNFEKLRIRTPEQVAEVEARVTALCAPLGHRVDVVVNYDGTRIDDEIEEAWAEMVARMEDRFYGRVTRYSSSAFLRVKLGRTLARGDAPPVFETAEAAKAYLDR
jgi:propionate CoA-transferase